MKSVTRVVELVVGSLLTSLTLPLRSAAQTTTANPLVGAWQTVMFVGDPGRLRPSPVHPAPELGREGAITGLRLFTREHFSTLTLILKGPRPALPDSSPTAEQLLTTWAPFAAAGGRYELQGDTLIATPLIGKNPRASARPSRYVYRVTGDTLFLTAANGITEVSVRVERNPP